MKRAGSFFRRYLLVHFLFAVLLPILLLFLSAGAFSPGDQTAAAADGLIQFRNYITLIGIILAVFIAVSWLFFYRIRKRLLRLQEAMAAPSAGQGLPQPVDMDGRPAHPDEIGQLEASFNRMIRQLADSRQREEEEETLRRRLIANLSHDLRTPLTAMRGHASRLRKEQLSPDGAASLDAVDRTITHVGELIDDLLAYTLLTAGKYPYRPEQTDMVRLVRASLATWYPVFEEAGFRIEPGLPESATFRWKVDPQWMQRVLDNLFQNIVRHAREGRYIGVAMDAGRETLTIEDRGPGMDGQSDERGAGIGLSIATYMLREMGLQAVFTSGESGTTVRIGTGIGKN